MRYIDCLIMNAGLQEVQAAGMKARFSYAVSRNKKALEPIIKSLEELTAPSEKFKEFVEERQKVLVEFSEKDAKGEPVVHRRQEGNRTLENYSIPGIDDKGGKFNTKMDEVKKKYKDTLDGQEAKEKKYQEFLDEEIKEDLNIIIIDIKLVPDGLTQKSMDGIYFMISDDSTPVRKQKAVK